MHRRKFVKYGLAGGVSSLIASVSGLAHGTLLNPTPPEIEGPFYPVMGLKDKDFDLTRIEGKTEVAKGRIIIVEGRILDTSGNAIEDATVDLWQANAAGRYLHPYDPNEAPLDPNFQGWAIIPSGKEGSFRFKTVFPGAYPASASWLRPPHIHFKINKSGYEELVTQMYFPDHELNKKDRLLNGKAPEEQKRMIAKKINGDLEFEQYYFDIVLAKS